MANDANIIKIKRSGTSGAPASLKLGELAYSYLTANGNPTSNGGDRLFIGANGVSGVTGNANDVIVIGGKYFTDLLDHERGILTASSALIVNADKKLDELLVDDLSLNGDTLSATGTLKLQAGTGNLIEVAANNVIVGGAFGGSQLFLDSGNVYLKQIRSGNINLVVGADGTATSTLTFNNDGSLTVPGTIKTLSNADLILAPNGTGLVQINTSTNSFTLPASRTLATGYVLTADTDGTTSWSASASNLSLLAGTAPNDTGDNATINLLTDDLEIRGDAGAITTALTSTTTGSNDHFVLTVNARFATTSDVGVAAFNSNTFSVGLVGDVDVKAGGISNSQLANSSTYLGSTLLTLGDTTGTTSTIAGVNSITASIGSGFTINADGAGNIWEFDTAGDLTFPDGSFVGVPNGPGTFGFTTPATTDFYINSGTLSWTFDQFGTLTLPSSGTIAEGAVITAGGDTVTTIEIAPAQDLGTDPNQKLVIYPTVGITEGNHLHLTSGNLAVTDLFFGSDSQYIRTRNDGRMSIGTDVADPEDSTSGYQWHFNADGTTSFPAYTFPYLDGNAADILITDGAGNLSWTQISTQLEVEADAGGPRIVNLLTDTYRLSGSGAISTALTVGTGEIINTISVATATNLVLGVASFDSTDFTVTSGAVGLNIVNTDVGTFGSATAIPVVTVNGKGLVTAVTTANIATSLSIAGTTGTDTVSLLSDTLSFLGATTPITVAVTDNTVTVAVADATTTTKGLASFTTDTFSVSSGVVDVKTGGISNTQLANSSVTFGTTNVALGSSSLVLAGLQQVNVDNIEINGNEISTTDTNGNLSLNPNGTGTVDVNSSRITGLAEPVDATDAATKAYVDAARSGLDVKQSVRAATTGPVTLSNTQTIDGVALSVGDRVLVKDQADAALNGVYVVSGSTWSRATDFDEPYEVTAGVFFFVEEGTVNADAGFVITSDNPQTVGTDPLTFTQFSGAGQIVAGDALSKTGNRLDVVVAASGGIEISADALQLKSTLAGNGLTYASGVLDIVGTANRISISADAVDIDSNYVGQSSITTLGTITTGTWNADVITYAYGGTGQSTYAKGDILYADAANSLSKLAAGNNGEVIQLQNGVPVWGVLDGGTY